MTHPNTTAANPTSRKPILASLVAALFTLPLGVGVVPPATAQAKAPSAARARSGKTVAPSAKVFRYVAGVIAAHDTDRDGKLQQSEWETLKGNPASIDANRDGEITSDEFARYVNVYASRRRIQLVTPEPPPEAPPAPLLQPTSGGPNAGPKKKPTAADGTASGMDPDAAPASVRNRPVPRRRDSKFFVPAERLPSGLPSWFHTQDRDGDGQITMAEYSSEINASTVAVFRRYDTNGDGVITSSEYLNATRKVKPKKPTKAPSKSAPSKSAPSKSAPSKSATSKSTPQSSTEAKPTTPTVPTSTTPPSGANDVSTTTSPAKPQLDQNGDGMISEIELPASLRRYFSRYDRNKDGLLDATEAIAIRKRLSRR